MLEDYKREMGDFDLFLLSNFTGEYWILKFLKKKKKSYL